MHVQANTSNKDQYCTADEEFSYCFTKCTEPLVETMQTEMIPFQTLVFCSITHYVLWSDMAKESG